MLDHTIHMIAVIQIRFARSESRAYYDTEIHLCKKARGAMLASQLERAQPRAHRHPPLWPGLPSPESQVFSKISMRGVGASERVNCCAVAIQADLRGLGTNLFVPVDVDSGWIAGLGACCAAGAAPDEHECCQRGA
jgi:hypothetical protein